MTAGTGAPQTSRTASVALVVLYLLTMASAAAVLLTPTSDPLWAAAATVGGCLALAGFGQWGRALSRGRLSSVDEQDVTGAGTMAASLACGLLLGLGVRGHYPNLMFSGLAATALLGFGPALLARRRRAARR